MRSQTVLRIAAALTVLYAAGHTAGMPWTPSHGPHEQAVVEAMRKVHFSAMGSIRSYWDFYQGFGISLSGLLAVQAILLWQLANVARDGGRYRAMIATQLVGFLFSAFIIGRYIFIVPLVLTLAIASCLSWALIHKDGAKVGKQQSIDATSAKPHPAA